MDTQKQKALFLDRDGIINIDHAYVHKIEDFEFCDGIFDLVHFFIQHNFKIIVITNQAGIGRGIFSEEDFFTLNTWMLKKFSDNNASIDQVYWCPHHASAGIGKYKKDCPNRKPKPGMILQAQKEFNLDLSKSILIGDKDSDIQCAHNARIGFSVLVESRYDKPKNPANLTVSKLDDIQENADLLNFLHP